MTCGAHKLVSSKQFLDYMYEELCRLLSALYSDLGKNYIGAHLHKCAQTFPPIFDLGRKKIVAPPSNENENYVGYLKDSLPKSGNF